MKILVFGDIHGLMDWEGILKKETFDKVVFLGDYVDSHENLSPDVFKTTLRKLIDVKQQLQDRCVLLYGNHDASYLNNEQSSQWNQKTNDECLEYLQFLYDERLIQPVFIHDDIIFSHAGVSKTWLSDIACLNDVYDITFDNLPLCTFDFNLYCGYDEYGDTVSQSPIWIRPGSLLQDKIDGYRQVVGHTRMEVPKEIDGCFFIDTMPKYYAIVENGTVVFKQNL